MNNSNLYAGYRYPAQIISHTVWLYHHYTLSFHDIVRIYLLKEKPMKWANAKLEDVARERSSYISGLRKADGSELSEFIEYLQNVGN
ncbi:hypothetical protein [Psychromonas hadalis]|uniref:hypothetical protein n=1 Tax=Psychromonas hadalis TaxID=211669 RepID=UPI0009FCFAB6|nr:hypothetical protein [Psychromonas hadalis]